VYKDMSEATQTQATQTQAFGAYFQCYRSPMATYKCLESFRRHYPTSTIVMLSDNGYNYAKMAEYFGCIYIHSHENYRMCDIESRNVAPLLKRIRNAFKLIPEEYVMWLEDDVSVNHRITDTFRYDINGRCPNVYSREMVEGLRQTYPLDRETYRWSGHGGSVFHKNNLIDYLENTSLLDDIVLNWDRYCLTSNFCQDFVISLVVNLQNGTIGPYEGHADGNHGLNPSIKIQHQYKSWYNTPLPSELVHLVEQ
jgi:hypothetical protein